jgi:succinate-semialdehyde dehydrogenase/glutarate-semialdehyde dehydrogenase
MEVDDMNAAPTPLSPDTELQAAAEKVVQRITAPAAGASRIEVHNPHDNSIVGHVADFGVDQALNAVAVADNAGRPWAATSPRHRADILRRWYELLIDNGEDLALLISLEMGKTLADARGEVTYGADFGLS